MVISNLSKLKFYLLALATVFLTASCFNNNLAKYYLDRKNYKMAIVELEKLAADNDPEALFILGNIYYKPLGVEQDIQKALGYFEKSAQGGFADAQYNLGVLYYKNDLINQNLSQAFY